MPTSIVTGAVIEVRPLMTTAGQLGINVLHYLCTSHTGLGATTQEIANLFNTANAARYKALISVAATFRGIGCRAIFPLPPSVEDFTTALLGVGTVAGDILPLQTCGLVKKASALAGRKNRGRMYIPFPGEADSDVNGLPTAGYITRLDSLNGSIFPGQVFIGAAGSSTCSFGVWSRINQLFVFTPTAINRTGWATQRRRGSLTKAGVNPF